MTHRFSAGFPVVTYGCNYCEKEGALFPHGNGLGVAPLSNNLKRVVVLGVSGAVFLIFACGFEQPIRVAAICRDGEDVSVV